MKISLRSMVIAAALFQGIGFLFVSLLNVVLRPYGGTYLALLASLYPGYDPTSGLAGVIVGTLYSLIAGAVAGFVFGSLYNFFTERV
jgi:ABC-type phosphate transport system permease subunit